jgi:hypothetical protein
LRKTPGRYHSNYTRVYKLVICKPVYKGAFPTQFNYLLSNLGVINTYSNLRGSVKESIEEQNLTHHANNVSKALKGKICKSTTKTK